MHALVAALLLTACSGSLVDHLNDFGTGTPDGGGTDAGGGCAQNASACGASCTACTGAVPTNGALACLNSACGYTCVAPYLRCSSGCCLPFAVAAGGDSTCAIMQDATASCWGAAIGSTAAASEIPEAVPTLSSVRRLALGSGHACAALNDGTVRCWGKNDFGQLGKIASADLTAAPGDLVASLSGATDIVVGSAHTCALTSGGAVCWGANDAGQAGTGTTSATATLNTVAGTAGATGISGGLRHTCVTINSGVSCWGADDSGQIGNGPGTAQATTATPVTFKSGGASPTFVLSGASDNCVIDGTSFDCWGLGTLGELGNGVAANQSTPQTANISSVSFAAAGAVHTCAVGSPLADSDNGVGGNPGLYCWGSNDDGQFGIGSSVGTASGPTTAVADIASASVTQLVAGSNHTCALLASTNDLLCWGSNFNGQVGIGPKGSPVTAPKQVGAQ